MNRTPTATDRRRSLRRVLTHAEAGQRFDSLLAAWLPSELGRPLSKTQIRRLIMAGAVHVEDRPLRRPAARLRAGQRLTARLRLDQLERSTARDAPWRITGASILYEDDALIAVDKPAGLPTHATLDPLRPHVVGLVRSYLMERNGSAATDPAAGPYLGVHQRLDRETSGVLLFSKTPLANPGLAQLFARHAVVKTYHVLTHRPKHLPPREWCLKTQLAWTAERRGRRVAAVAFGGRQAETRFRRLDVLPRALFLEAQPVTGRRHQIRVQLAQFGAPILGDDLYGAPRDAGMAQRLMLHAARLELAHPLTGQALSIESPRPADFRQLLTRLHRGAARR